MIESIINSIDNGLYALNEIFAGPVSSYCRLETVDQNALVADDGSLISICKLEGSLKHVGTEEFVNIVSRLTEHLQSSLNKPGHSIQFVFDYNIDSERYLQEIFASSKRTMNNLGLNLDNLINNEIATLNKYCNVEQTWIVLWTHSSVLPEKHKKEALKDRDKSAEKFLNIFGCQNLGRTITALHDAHDGFVAGIESAFHNSDLILYKLAPKEALRDIRLCIDPDFTSSDWQPLIPGDSLPMRLADSTNPKNILENCIYPDFKSQLFPRVGENISGTVIRIGDILYAPLLLTLCPQTPRPFQELFRTLAKREERIPYRISFLFNPNGLELGLKPFLASILSFSSSSNKRFNTAVDALKELDLEGICNVKFRICLMTSVRIDNNLDDAHALIRRRVSELAKTVQGWGTCETSQFVGDPLLGVMATVPALMPSSPSPVTAAPLQEAIGLLPYRPASPWRAGSFLLRTQDGKPMPFCPNSSEQAAWIDIGVAPMGSGKSVFLNAYNFAFITQPGLARLPWLSIVDIGPSSSGLITLLKESLPLNQKHLAAYHRLRMTPDFAINPFDTPLGLRKPLPAHKAFLVNLLSLLATPLDATAPKDGVAGVCLRAIDLAYEEFADGNHPKLYQHNTIPELHKLIMKLGIKLDASTTWWEITDTLFNLGYIHEALSAQRYAVPLLADIATQITQNSGIQNMYDEKLRQNVWRAIVDTIEAYVILKEPTQFDIGDAQIVSLDLDEVAPRGGATADRQAAVMYMLARHILASRFFLMPADVSLMPKKYQDYHFKRIDAIRQDPKRICYDEAHRVTKNQSVAGQLQTDMTTMSRESRKWNLSLGLYSQSIDDMPDIITELATSVFILGVGTEKTIQTLTERFGLNGACEYALSKLGKPDAAGANFVAYYKTGQGNSQLNLTLTLCPQKLWAFSTTTEDVTIRNSLYQILGTSEALLRLAKFYPTGSAKKEVERRRRIITDESVDVIKQIVNEIRSKQ